MLWHLDVHGGYMMDVGFDLSLPPVEFLTFDEGFTQNYTCLLYTSQSTGLGTGLIRITFFLLTLLLYLQFISKLSSMYMYFHMTNHYEENYVSSIFKRNV